MYARITRWTVGVLAIAALVCTGAALAGGGPAKHPPQAKLEATPGGTHGYHREDRP